jgi:hypothetical protein
MKTFCNLANQMYEPFTKILLLVVLVVGTVVRMVVLRDLVRGVVVVVLCVVEDTVTGLVPRGLTVTGAGRNRGSHTWRSPPGRSLGTG